MARRKRLAAAQATELRWYLRSAGELTTAAPPAREPVTEFTYDPADPVPTAGGQTLIPPYLTAGPVDQADVRGTPGRARVHLRAAGG